MLLARRGLISGVAALPIVVAGRARAAEFNYKLAHDISVVHPLHIRLVEAAERIRIATGGRVEITVFPNSQLGSDIDTLGYLQAGTVPLFILPAGILSSLVPAVAIANTGFAFKTYAQVWRAMDGSLGNYIRKEIGGFGIVPFGRVWNNGFRHSTTATKPVTAPEDLQGVKFRVPASPIATNMFRAFGAVPQAINFNLVHSALETHTVDGQENPLIQIQAAKLYEVQTYCSLTYHSWDAYWMLANAAMWKGLPDRLRDIIEHEMDRAGQEERDDLARLDPHLRGDLAGAGLKFNAVDRGAFQDLLRKDGFYADWRSKFGETAWKLLEEHAGELA